MQINNTRHILHTYQTDRNFKKSDMKCQKECRAQNSNVVLQVREITVLQERQLLHQIVIVKMHLPDASTTIFPLTPS